MFGFKILLYMFKLVLILSRVAVFMGDFLYSLYSLFLKEIDFIIPCVIHFVFLWRCFLYLSIFGARCASVAYYELYRNLYWGLH